MPLAAVRGYLKINDDLSFAKLSYIIKKMVTCVNMYFYTVHHRENKVESYIIGEYLSAHCSKKWKIRITCNIFSFVLEIKCLDKKLKIKKVFNCDIFLLYKLVCSIFSEAFFHWEKLTFFKSADRFYIYIYQAYCISREQFRWGILK